MTLASEWLCSFALVCLAAWQHGGIAACPARALRQTAPEKPSALQPAVHGVRAAGLGWPRRGSLVWPAACVCSAASRSAEMMRRGHWGQERWKGGTRCWAAERR
jgi:hypothetical protein